MKVGAYYWINLVNMIEVHGPYKSADAARNGAARTFKDPPDNGKDSYVVGVAIVKVEEVGEVVVTTKYKWRSDK